MGKIIDETGNVYGKLTVLERAGYKDQWAAWLCECECGNKIIVAGTMLRQGRKTHCSDCNDRSIDETGNQYGLLTVLKREENGKNGQARWLCQCECGNKIITRANTLRQGRSQSCGCQRVVKLREARCLPPGEAAFNALFSQYRCKALGRGLSWRLTKKHFRELTKQPCHYCGRVLFSEKQSVNGSYAYNGIDRLDNSKGYLPSNVVACCWECNRAKGAMDYDEFLGFVDKIARHHGLGG